MQYKNPQRLRDIYGNIYIEVILPAFSESNIQSVLTQ